ncbi:MAG: rRNA pseudouridine synthase [Ruminococcaceae bacterium]|nr:rRNA pseudouridine synthase [Oscillospiraceae bacterium]
MMESIRISKYFTDCGIMSRRAAEAEIQGGKVKVNGKIATLGQKIDPAVDVVEYNGKIIRMLTNEKFYIMLNKPRGIVTTASDEKGRTDVTHLCRDLKDSAGKSVRVYPIGRLDMDSDGLLLLTNDGELANKLTHPRHSIPKIYHVTIDGVLSDPQINVLGNSILIDGRETVPVTVQKLAQNASNTIVQFELYEGRNRQIRRMCDAHGVKIKRLCRVAVGDVKLGDLPVGKWRFLTENEIEYLQKC